MTGHGGRDTGRALHGARRGVLQKLLIYYVKTTSESCRRRRWPLGPLACLDMLTNTLLVKPSHFGCRIVAVSVSVSVSAVSVSVSVSQRRWADFVGCRQSESRRCRPAQCQAS